MFQKWNVGVFDTNYDYTFQITFWLVFLICQIKMSKRFLTLKEAKDFVFEPNVIQNGIFMQNDKSMPRKKFRNIKKIFHLVDNLNLIEGKAAKIKTFYKHL